MAVAGSTLVTPAVGSTVTRIGSTGRGDRLHACRAVKEGGKDQGVQGAPGVELLASHGEPVWGGAQREPLADDPALLVVLGVRHRSETAPYLVEGAARDGGELLDGDGVAVDE